MAKMHKELEKMKKKGGGGSDSKNSLHDLSVYVSALFKEPNDRRNCESYNNKSSFMFSVDKEEVNQFIYFTLMSENGCKIMVNLEFAGVKHKIVPEFTRKDDEKEFEDKLFEKMDLSKENTNNHRTLQDK